MSSYIDKASSHVAIGFKACAVQVFVRTLSKVASFGPCEQFVPAACAPCDPFARGWS
jgi:hypothetical protein